MTTIIPAQPGFKVVALYELPGEKYEAIYDLISIIGWSVGNGGDVYPLTAEYCISANYLMDPAGRVFSADKDRIEAWDDIHQFAAEMSIRMEERNAA